MTVIMTTKNQVTIPKKIAIVLGLKKGSMFEVEVQNNRIELIPLVTQEKVFTKEMYHKLDMLSAREKGKEKKVTRKFIQDIKKGTI